MELVHIRQYEKDVFTRYMYPTAKGIALRPHRLVKLFELSGCIDKCVEKLRNKDGDVKLRKHLGGGIFVGVVNGYQCVNLRKYFVPVGSVIPFPTRFGIAIRFNEWNALHNAIGDLLKNFPSLMSSTPCHMNTDHQLNYLDCPECCPFGIDMSLEENEQ